MGRASPRRHAALLARLLGAELVSTLRLAPGALPGRSPQFPPELVRRASLPELHRFPPQKGRVCPGVHQQELRVLRLEHHGTIQLDVNGKTRQKSDLNALIWSVPETISDLSGLVALAAALAVNVARGAAEVGKPAPEFALVDIQGRAHKLSDYKGKIVVIEWVNPECPIVVKHYNSQNMQGTQKSAAADGAGGLS